MNTDIENLKLRELRESDSKIISKSFQDQGWDKPESQYLKYLAYQKEGKRDIIIAEFNQEFAGYLTINWISDYIPFREVRIPEIVDLNVLKKFQRKGIASRLLDEAEKRIRKISKFVGIGFGVTKDYGPAQILYFNRDYKPNGNGLVRDSKSVKYGEKVTINDDVVFYLIKEFKS